MDIALLVKKFHMSVHSRSALFNKTCHQVHAMTQGTGSSDKKQGYRGGSHFSICNLPVHHRLIQNLLGKNCFWVYNLCRAYVAYMQVWWFLNFSIGSIICLHARQDSNASRASQLQQPTVRYSSRQLHVCSIIRRSMML